MRFGFTLVLLSPTAVAFAFALMIWFGFAFAFGFASSHGCSDWGTTPFNHASISSFRKSSEPGSPIHESKMSSKAPD